MVSPFSRRRRVTSLLDAAGRRGRSRSLTAALAVVVLGVLGAGVVVHVGVAAQRANVDLAGGPGAPSFGVPALKGFVPGDRALKSGAAERLTERGAPARPQRAGHEERLRSRVALRGASRAELLKAGRLQFAGVFSDPLFDGRHPDPGNTVIEYRGARGALVEDAGGRKLLLKSTLPLQAPAANGELAPVDLSLRESAETFTTTNSNADVQIFKDPARGISVVNEDFSVSDATATDGAQPDGVQTDGRVFFDQAAGDDSDVGFIAVPKPTGVQVGWLLGTADAPQTYKLNLDLPEGARVRRTQTDDPIPGDPPRTFEIVDRDGQSLAFITPPMTFDSDGVSVESSMHIVGRDRLVVDVKHHGEDLRYPLFVDPELIPVPRGRWGGDWQGWGTYQVPTTPTRVASDYNHNYYGWALDHPAYNPSGAYMSMPTNTWFDIGTSRGFEYRAPPGTYISEATFGNISHQAIWPTGNHNMWWQGILNPARTAWQNLSSSYASGSAGFVGMSAGGAAEQNYANIGIGATAANYQGRLWSGNLSAWVKMDWANVYLGDSHPPQLTSAPPANETWSTTTSRTRTVSGSDYGSGMVKFRLTGPGIDQTTPLSYGEAQNITYTPAEGSHEYTLTAIDAVGNTSSPQTWTEKIDHSQPSLDTPTGTLWEAREQPDDHRYEGFYGSQPTLSVPVSDSGSGVKEVVVLRDGIQWAAPATITGGTATWTLNLDSSLPDGRYKIELAARDNVWTASSASADQHEKKTEPFYVTVDRSGDVAHAAQWTGDPADDASELIAKSWVSTGNRSARMETVGTVRTTRVVSCAANAQGCREMRDQEAEGDTTISLTRGTSPQDPRITTSFPILAAAVDPTETSQHDGLVDLLQPWQTPPPGHGTMYVQASSEENVVVDGEELTTTRTRWSDATTGLPVREAVDYGDDGDTHVTYYSYATTRTALEDVDPAFFAVGGDPVPTGSTEQELPASDIEPDPAPDAPLAEQIEIAQAFRSELNLADSVQAIEDILLNVTQPARAESLDLFGTPLLPAELAAVKTFLRLQTEAANELTAFAADHAPTYAGAYLDPQTGTLRVGFTSDLSAGVAAVKALFSDPSRIEAFSAVRTLASLDSRKRAIEEDLYQGELDQYDISSVTVEEEANAVILGVTTLTADVEAQLRALYGADDGLVIEEVPNPVASQISQGFERSPKFVENFGFAFGGIGIKPATTGRDQPYICTSAFNVYRTVHGRKQWYTSTAGHCADQGSRQHWSHTVRNFNANDGSTKFIRRFMGLTSRNLFDDARPVDAALLKIERDYATPRVYLRHDNGRPRFARVKGTTDFLKKNSIVCYTGATTGGSRCGRIQKFEDPVKYDNEDDPSRGPRRVSTMRVKLFDICRDHSGDSGAATYASREGEMGIYAVGIFSGQFSGDASKPGDADCEDQDKSKLIIVQTIGPALARANVQLLRTDLRNQGSSVDP